MRFFSHTISVFVETHRRLVSSCPKPRKPRALRVRSSILSNLHRCRPTCSRARPTVQGPRWTVAKSG